VQYNIKFIATFLSLKLSIFIVGNEELVV